MQNQAPQNESIPLLNEGEVVSVEGNTPQTPLLEGATSDTMPEDMTIIGIKPEVFLESANQNTQMQLSMGNNSNPPIDNTSGGIVSGLNSNNTDYTEYRFEPTEEMKDKHRSMSLLHGDIHQKQLMKRL